MDNILYIAYKLYIMTDLDIKKQRALQLMEFAVNAAKNISASAVDYAKYERKTARIFRKGKYSKRLSAMKKYTLLLTAYHNAIAVAVEMSKPIPRFPYGGSAGTIGDNQQPEFITL